MATNALADSGIPEPPLVIYGQAFSKSNNGPVSISTAVVGVSDGQGLAVTLNGTSTPPLQIISVNGVSYYLARVPFDTRQAGSATLSAPANSFPLSPTSSTYALSATVNNQPATFASPAQATFTYSATELGRVDHVDFFINTTGQPDDGYLDWARSHFGNASDARAARTADPDGDGITNEQEFYAGTDPLDGRSALKILGLIPSSGGNLTISWSSVAGKIYVVEKSADLKTWAAYGSSITASGPMTSFTDRIAGAGPKLFYRVRTAP